MEKDQIYQASYEEVHTSEESIEWVSSSWLHVEAKEIIPQEPVFTQGTSLSVNSQRSGVPEADTKVIGACHGPSSWYIPEGGGTTNQWKPDGSWIGQLEGLNHHSTNNGTGSVK